MDSKRMNMGEIATSERMITLFYNAESSTGKQALAFAKSEGIPIEEINILKTPLTGTQIAELAGRLDLTVGDLVNQQHPSYKKNFDKADYDADDWIKMIRNHPEIMKQPIALRGKRTILVETPSDMMKIYKSGNRDYGF